jgi:hypothetical protein
MPPTQVQSLTNSGGHIGKDHLREFGVDWENIKLVLKEIGNDGSRQMKGSCEHCNKTSGFYKRYGISQSAEQLSTS